MNFSVKKTEQQAWGMGELPMNGRRYALVTEKIVHDDGTEELRRSMHPVPESMQPYFWIPSFGNLSLDEMRYLSEEYQYELANPTDEMQEYDAKRAARKALIHKWYRDACDQRYEELTTNKRHFARST